jgi:cytoskeletal protein CcmA (bactofilin family)
MRYETRMSERKRRFLEGGLAASLNTSAVPTVVGADSVIVGNLSGKGPFIVSGEVHGDGELAGALTLSVTGRWYGNIRAQQARVAGKIIGCLTVEDKLEIGNAAEIRGTVRARTIAIASGAIVDGEIEITSQTPLVEFEEKRDES